MDFLLIVVIAGGVDILGRVLTLIFMMEHSTVKTLRYRTWVLLSAFLNFAWVIYWFAGYAPERKE